MEKPLYEMKRFSHKIRRSMQKVAKQRGIDFMAGPQGQVLHLIDRRREEDQDTLIKDIEHSLAISKSVTSNLVKRMENKGLIYLEPSPTDKRAKYVRLTDSSKAQLQEIRNFFEEMNRQLVQSVSDEDLAAFARVLQQFADNLEKIGESHD